MNKAVLREVWTGRSIDGKFPLLEWIGGSETAAVFRTEITGAKGVVRLVRANAPEAAGYLSAWELAAGLSHPNLMRVYASGKVTDKYGDVIYAVSEFADEALSQIIPERSLSVDEVREMLPPVLDALTYLHGRSLVYRQLRPSNILVVGDRIKLPLDGVVRAGSAETARGSRIYDAPEVGSLNTSPAADAWSLGATLVEALTQKPPQWNRSANSEPIVPANVPAPFAEMARRSLRTDPARRLSVAQVKAALSGAALPPEPAAAQAKPPVATPPAKTPVPAEKTAVATPAPPPQPRKETPPAKVATAAAATAAAVASTSLPPPPAHVQPLRRTEVEAAAADAPSSIFANRRLWIAAAALVVVVLLVVLLTHRSKPQPAAEQTAVPAATVPTPAGPAAPASAPPPSSSTGSAQGAVIDRVQPDIPEHAMHTIRGKIEIVARAHVNEQGDVTAARLEHRGSSQYFATRTLDAVRKWKFRAPQENGRPVASDWNVRFALRRSGIEATPEQVRP